MINEIKLKGILKKDVSKKTGNEYEYLALIFPNGYEKRVFLEDSEKFMLADASKSTTNPFGK